MDTSLSVLFHLYQFPTGRRIFALGKVIKAAGAEHEELVEHCNAAIAHDRKCLALEREWQGLAAKARGKVPAVPSPSPTAVKIDALTDRTITAIRDHAMSQTAGAPPDDPIHTTVASFLRQVFPSHNLHDVTLLDFVQELAVVDDVLARLKSDALAPTVNELGLSRLVTRLAGLAEQYRDALHAPEPETLTFGQVRAARAEGQDLLLEAVAIIVGKHHSKSTADIEARARLLAPILEQNAAIGAAMRRRSTVDDVDPETGEPDPTASAALPPGTTPNPTASGNP